MREAIAYAERVPPQTVRIDAHPPTPCSTTRRRERLLSAAR